MPWVNAQRGPYSSYLMAGQWEVGICSFPLTYFPLALFSEFLHFLFPSFEEGLILEKAQGQTIRGSVVEPKKDTCMGTGVRVGFFSCPMPSLHGFLWSLREAVCISPDKVVTVGTQRRGLWPWWLPVICAKPDVRIRVTQHLSHAPHSS